MIQVMLVQFEIRPKEGPGNVDRLLGYIRDNYKQGTDLVIVPEAVSVATDPSQIQDDLDKIVKTAKKLGTNIIYGAKLFGEEGYNKAILVGIDGSIDEYTKMNLWGNEGGKAGSEIATWELDVKDKQLKLRPLVCADMQHFKRYISEGIDLYVVIANLDISKVQYAMIDLENFAKEAKHSVIIVDSGGVPYDVGGHKYGASKSCVALGDKVLPIGEGQTIAYYNVSNIKVKPLEEISLT